ncbi:MAG: peptide chain release factor 3 [Dehalococcoidia bacterium]
MSSLATPSADPTRRDLAREVARRRTFAIISHPDAGKTTLTEKLLLYAGAIEMAGAVRARRNQRYTTSDWMAMEQERGISVTASALEMEYRGFRLNLLDTPGHQDFSEDTYRTLTAADSAVMVLDSAKGIESQTVKLFHACRLRGVPILTFINKLDHAGREPLDLLDEIERVLGIAPVPMNWPIGDGVWFQGVYDLGRREVLRYQRAEHRRSRTSVKVAGLDDPTLPSLLGEHAAQKLREDADLLAGAGSGFDEARFLTGNLTPVYFGSALNNFGVETFLDALLRLAPAPSARETDRGPIAPTEEAFSGFIFKIQANMDPRHRDRMAFLRVCSGRFQKDMTVLNPRLGRPVRLSRAYRLFARDREPIEEAFPGDVIGVINPGVFAIGDTVTAGEPARYAAIPRFPPELFAAIVNKDIGRYKQFHRGLAQLEEEGAVQVLYNAGGAKRDSILGAVGELQFDVVLARLKGEYGVEARIEQLPFTSARWIGGPQDAVQRLVVSTRGTLRCQDLTGRPVLLFHSSWDLEYCQRENPGLTFSEVG